MKHRTAFIIVFASIAVAIAATGARYYHHLKQFVHAASFKELAAIADLKVHDISSWRSERLGDAQVLATNPAVVELLRGTRSGDTVGKEGFRQWLETFRESYGYDGVLLVDPGGSVVVSVPGDRPLDPFVKKILSSATNPAFSDFYLNPDRKAFLFVSAPVRPPTKPSAPPVGYVVLYIDPAKSLYPYIQLWPTPSATAETMLVGRDGDQVVYLNELRHRKAAPLNLRLPPTAAVVGAHALTRPSGAEEGVDYRGVSVLAVSRTVPGSGWAVVAKVDREEALSPLRQSGMLLAALVAALVAGSGIALLFLSRRAEIRSYLAQREALEERDRARTQLLEATRHQEIRFRQLAEAVPNVVWMGTPDGDIDFLNSRWSQFTGIPSAESLGKRWMEALHPDDLVLTTQRWGESVRTGEPYEIEYRFRRRDGEYRWFLARGVPLRDDAGAITRWLGTCTDITEMKRIEQEREMYVHAISHDLRTPLAAIHGYAQLLAPFCMDDESNMFLKSIQQGVERALVMTEDMVDAARLAGAQLVLQKEMVDLAPFLDDLLLRNEPNLGSGRIRMTVQESLPPIIADRARLERVILNLLTNALKYAPVEIPVEVTAGQTAENVEIAVTDHGQGIAPEDLPHIFERFYRPKHGRKAGGVGLGLYITKKLVEAHGGSVEAESELQKGSTFRIILPVADENAMQSLGPSRPLNQRTAP